MCEFNLKQSEVTSKYRQDLYNNVAYMLDFENVPPLLFMSYFQVLFDRVIIQRWFFF